MPENRVFRSTVLFEMCGQLAQVTGVLTVPIEYPELYTRDTMAAVVRRQNAVLYELRLKLQDLTRDLLVEGD